MSSAASVNALLTRPGLSIDAGGQWLYHGDPITNEAILNYFKRQLHRDADGYWIENRFGDKREQAYLDSVEALPLRAVAAQAQRSESGIALWLRLETGDEAITPASALYVVAEDCLVAELPESGIPVRLSGLAMASLVSYLHLDENESYHLVLPEERSKAPLQRASADRFLQPPAGKG